ncbi:MAG: PLP-dependent aminotransferase family protein [Faecalibacterium sp.]
MLQLTFQLNSADKTPLYEQLYAAIAAQIRDGSIAAGTKLPGKRSLANELSISVNTVDTAYQILAAEGYLEARPRSGFFTHSYREIQPFANRAAHPLPSEPQKNSTTTQAPPSASVQGTHPPCTAQPSATPPRFDLSGTGIDPTLFPFRTWGRIQKELLYASPELLLRGAAQGDENLRTALAEYLGAFRGVRCHAGQIVVGAGMEYLLSLLAPLLPRHGGVENPGYPRAKAVLENNDIQCSHLPLDEKGLSVSALQESGADFCYVTPSHQYPTGVTMPVGRRAELLLWANEGACTAQTDASTAPYHAKTGDEPAPPMRYIIEDDYDSEFRFDVRPLPSLQGMAGAAGNVIYLATFSKSLAPSIRIAAMVLPEPLLCAWHARYGSYASTVSRFEQQTLCRFLQEGYFTRHLARTRGIYKARRNALVQALEDAFGKENIQLQGVHTGLHLLLQLKNAPPDTEIAARCGEMGIKITPLRASYAGQGTACPPSTVLLGYGALREEDAPQVAQQMAQAMGQAIPLA